MVEAKVYLSSATSHKSGALAVWVAHCFIGSQIDYGIPPFACQLDVYDLRSTSCLFVQFSWASG